MSGPTLEEVDTFTVKAGLLLIAIDELYELFNTLAAKGGYYSTDGLKMEHTLGLMKATTAALNAQLVINANMKNLNNGEMQQQLVKASNAKYDETLQKFLKESEAKKARNPRNPRNPQAKQHRARNGGQPKLPKLRVEVNPDDLIQEVEEIADHEHARQNKRMGKSKDDQRPNTPKLDQEHHMKRAGKQLAHVSPANGTSWIVPYIKDAPGLAMIQGDSNALPSLAGLGPITAGCHPGFIYGCRVKYNGRDGKIFTVEKARIVSKTDKSGYPLESALIEYKPSRDKKYNIITVSFIGDTVAYAKNPMQGAQDVLTHIMYSTEKPKGIRELFGFNYNTKQGDRLYRVDIPKQLEELIFQKDPLEARLNIAKYVGNSLFGESPYVILTAVDQNALQHGSKVDEAVKASVEELARMPVLE